MNFNFKEIFTAFMVLFAVIDIIGNIPIIIDLRKKSGQIQSEKFRSIYEAYEIDEIFSSDAYRCLETVKPLGRDLGLTVGIASDISEYQYSRDKEKPLKFAKKFLKASKDSETPKTVLLCSHNPVLPKILKELAGAMAVDEIDRGLEPGDGWVLFHRDGKVRAINFISAP